MEHQSNQLFLLSDRSTSNSRSTNNYSDLSNQLQHNHSNASPNRLPSEDSSNAISNQLPSDDSGFFCKCKQHSGNFPETTSEKSEDNQDTNSRKDETRRKSVSFSLGSSSDLIDENLCVTEIDIDSVPSTNSDPSSVNNESTSSFQRNGNSIAQNNSFTSRHSRARINENASRNITFKRQRSAYSESDRYNIMLSDCNHAALKMNTRTTLPVLGGSLNTDNGLDQRSIFHDQQSPEPPCSIKTKDQQNLPQCLSGTCHDHIHPNCQVNRFRSHPNIYPRHHDPESSAPLLDNNSCGTCSTPQESYGLPRETQSSNTVTKSAVSNITNDKKVDAESVVSAPRSYCTSMTYLFILMVFNIIFLVAIAIIILTPSNHRTYLECPLCKDVMDEMKNLNGGKMNKSVIDDLFKENDKDDRCCLNHAFVFNLMAQTDPRNQAHQQSIDSSYGKVMDIIQNSSEKAFIDLESLKGTIPFQSPPGDDALPGKKSDMEMIKWNSVPKMAVKGGSSWDVLGSDTQIKIPLTGVYYIYAMVQYWYESGNSTQPSDNMPNVNEFPLSVSLYKVPPSSERKPFRIVTVTQHCKLTTTFIEHNIIMERIVRLTRDDTVFLAASSKQFLKDGNKVHHIGLLKVD
ncbi:hypothetical protein ACJMK2_018810 [Sinanodonta woodiana]|uniref:TNF family profile domain-containing protein n=1 Tax=Sinanodonta woodiana TaxID=1069815 RepID=A0ABD3UG48_SINWO